MANAQAFDLETSLFTVFRDDPHDRLVESHPTRRRAEDTDLFRPLEEGVPKSLQRLRFFRLLNLRAMMMIAMRIELETPAIRHRHRDEMSVRPHAARSP